MKRKKRDNQVQDLENGKYYLYHLANNPDEDIFDYSTCSNFFELEEQTDKQIIKKRFHLYGYCQNGELFDIVTGKKLLNIKELDKEYLDYLKPVTWLAHLAVYEVSSTKVAEQLRYLVNHNLVKAYAEKQEYVANIPNLKYHQLQDEQQKELEANVFLENYRNKLK